MGFNSGFKGLSQCGYVIRVVAAMDYFEIDVLCNSALYSYKQIHTSVQDTLRGRLW